MNLLRGLTAPAWLVGLARGMAEAAIMAALVVATTWLATGQVGGLAPYAPLLLVVLRTAEGWADHIDPAKRRDPNATP